jgi:prevent-host-death family protein
MISVKEDTTIVGITELRKMIPQILKKIKQEKVILTRRNRPIGILVDYEEYERMEKMIGAFEDQVLGQLAKERASRKDRKTIDIEEAERRVGINSLP